MTDPIEQARSLLRSASLPKSVVRHLIGEPIPEVSESLSPGAEAAEILEESLIYQVAIGRGWRKEQDEEPSTSVFSGYGVHSQVTDEDVIPLGRSKYRGLPHLPAGMPWPTGLYFGAQFNLAELAQVDRSERLPKEGMLYIFYNGALEFKVIHWLGGITEFERRPYPEPSTLPGAKYYLENFVAGETIEFSPHWLLATNDGERYDHSEIVGLLPPELVKAVSAALGAPLALFDCDRRIYGRRFSYQDEFEIEGFDAHGEPIFDDPSRRVVFFHDQFGDAAVHFWCSPGAAARGDFSGVKVTSSCS